MLYNEEIIKRLSLINADLGTCLTILFGIENKCNFSMFLNNNKEINSLIALNIIERTSEGFSLNIPLWSTNVQTFISVIENKEVVKLKKAQAEKVATVDINAWIDEWVTLFPKSLKRVIGYDVHGNKEECRKRMIKFMSSNPSYNKEIVMKATKYYLAEQESKGWTYTKKNVKFIYDENGSYLEIYCDKVISGEINEIIPNVTRMRHR